MKTIQFSDAIYASVLDGMKNLLGESAMQAILFHHQLIRYAQDPREFHGHLHSIFKEGTVTIEKIIVRELFRTLNLPYEEKGSFDFEEHVNHARQLSLGGQMGS